MGARHICITLIIIWSFGFALSFDPEINKAYPVAVFGLRAKVVF